VIRQTISHYRVIKKLGAGTMGVVYEADDLRLRRRVALKFLPEGVVHDRQAIERLKREARAASALNHQNIVTIYAIDESEGRDFIVMACVEAESLAARLGLGQVELPQLLDWGTQVADALAGSPSRPRSS